MHDSLIFLGVILHLRLCTVPAQHTVRAVFADGQRDIRDLRMPLVAEGAVVVRRPLVPSHIFVIGGQVRDVKQRAVRLRHPHIGDGGQPGAVELPRRLMQLAQDRVHRLRLPADPKLVGQSPKADRRMVVVL